MTIAKDHVEMFQIVVQPSIFINMPGVNIPGCRALARGMSQSNEPGSISEPLASFIEYYFMQSRFMLLIKHELVTDKKIQDYSPP